MYFAGGVPDVATTEGQYVLAHELAHTLQDDRSATVRRINTPDAPKFRLGWDEEERTKTYRNHLLTLKWQLVNNKLKVSPEMVDDAHKATYNVAPADLELFEILRK